MDDREIPIRSPIPSDRSTELQQDLLAQHVLIQIEKEFKMNTENSQKSGENNRTMSGKPSLTHQPSRNEIKHITAE